MRVNMNKTKVMKSGERQKVRQKAVRWPCGVCNKGVGSNSLQCNSSSCHPTISVKALKAEFPLQNNNRSHITNHITNPGSWTYHNGDLLLCSKAAGKLDDELLSASQFQTVCRLTSSELQWQHTDANQCSPMTLIKALSNHRFHSLTKVHM